MVKCPSCGGTYNPTSSDGTRYFHACPPLSSAELAAAVAAGAVQLADKETVDEAIASRIYTRANARNENIVALSGKDAGEAIAAGAAPIAVPDGAPVQVVVDMTAVAAAPAAVVNPGP